MDVYINYLGYDIIKTGRGFQDYRVDLDGRYRWGTLDEIKTDINKHIDGVLIPYEPNK